MLPEFKVIEAISSFQKLLRKKKFSTIYGQTFDSIQSKYDETLV